MKFKTSILFLMLAMCLFLSTGIFSQDIEQSHINANIPVTFDEFNQIIMRDLKAYFSQMLSMDIVIKYELLRHAPTQSGVAYPKFYAWVSIKNNGNTVDSGAVRIAAIDKKRIEVTDFFSKDKIRTEPKSIELVFPRSLCDNIRNRAGLK